MDFQLAKTSLTDTPTWHKDVRAKIIEETTNKNNEPPTKEPKDTCEIVDDNNKDEFDCSLHKPVIKSSSEPLKVAKQLVEFAEFHGLEDLSNAILNVNDILRDYQLHEPQKQTCIPFFK